MLGRGLIAGLLIIAASVAVPARAALNVWVDFNASWATELYDAATAAGVSPFTTVERTTIETNILTELNRIYADYQIAFVTSNPGGSYNYIDMGSTTTISGLLGDAPLLFSSFLHHTDFGGKVNMYAENFAFIIESADPRATQITELSVAIAGTAAHELGHSLGLHHHHAYGNAGISPANYSATAGIQNTAIIATGSTGLDEAGRESQRVLGKWERALLDITGGSGLGGPTVVNSPVTAESESGDAGNNAATAQALSLQTGETSKLKMGFVIGSLSSATDVDWYKMTVAAAGNVTLDLWSDNVFEASWNPFNTSIQLIGPDGSTVLGSNGNAVYAGNTYGSGSFGTTDSFLPNVTISTPGTYYFAVSSASGFGDYGLIIGFDLAAIPEPSIVLLVSAGGLLIYFQRRRRA